MIIISLSAVHHDLINLRVQNFATIASYNSELFRITSQLAICGHKMDVEEQIERTMSTFHATNLILLA
jgi:hypothetical protein